MIIFNNTSADFVLISVENDHNFEQNENRATVKVSKKRDLCCKTCKSWLAMILDKMNLDITAGTTVDDHDLYNAPMLVRKPNTLKRFHK